MKLIITLLFGLFSICGFAQTKKLDTIKIKTSAECDMCKASIEKALNYEKGVKSADLDVKTKVVTIVYKPAKTDIAKLRSAIVSCGYDADDIPANNKAYMKLDPCCKKGAHSDKKE